MIEIPKSIVNIRDYQDFGAEAPFKYFESGGQGNPLLAYPTGTGKSVIIAECIRRVYARFTGQRVIVATHSETLVAQNAAKLKEMWPQAMIGICCDGLKRKDCHYPITFATIQTIWNMAHKYGKVNLLFIDEAHMVPTNENAAYIKFIADLKQANPNLKVIGLTATPYRIGQGKLTDEGGIFTDLIVDATSFHAFNWFLDQGYLTHLNPKRTDTEMETEGLRTQMGEYNIAQMQREFDRSELTEMVLTEMLDLSVNRHHGLIFATGVQHVVNVAALLASRFKESVTFVHSKMSGEQKKENIAAFKAGRYRWMVNNGILTTGFDFPGIDVIAMLRATNSPGLWVQMLGRGTRTVFAMGYDIGTAHERLQAIAAGPKPDCLVLDFSRNTARLGPINDPRIPKPKGKGAPGEAPVRECDACGSYNHASATSCFFCGHEFPRRLKIEVQASEDELIKKGVESAANGASWAAPKIKTFNVDLVTYQFQPGNDILGKTAAIKAVYRCKNRKFEKWINLEGRGAPAGRKWWKENCGQEAPETTIQALELLDSLRTPVRIDVLIEKKPCEVHKIYYGDVDLQESEVAEDSEMAG